MEPDNFLNANCSFGGDEGPSAILTPTQYIQDWNKVDQMYLCLFDMYSGK